MNFKAKLFGWALLSTALSFSSCSKDTTEHHFSPTEKVQETSKKLGKIPYASKEELDKFSANQKIVNYALSRETALFDLQDFKKEVFQNKENLALSELPVIVYDYDNTPKYYEFIVLENGKEIGTITSFAKKEVPGFTAYVLPFVRNYSDKNATLYSNVYPNISERQEQTLQVSARKVISKEELQIREEARAFWEEIDNPKTDELPISPLVRAWNEEHTIPEFNNEALLRTHFWGDCGPAALAWLYRAYNTHYKGVYYPLHGENDNPTLKFYRMGNFNASRYYEGNSTLYKDLAEKCRVGYGMDPFKGATLPGDLKKAANDIFPNHKLEGGGSISIGSARSSIEGNNPVILLMNSWNGIIPNYHYVVGFGTKNRYNTYNLWLFKVRKVHTDSWVRVTDNGATISNHNYEPYHMNTHAILGKDFITFTLYRK